MDLSNHLSMVGLNLSLDNVRNCEETTMFVKEYEKIIKCKEKGILDLAYKQGPSFKKSKEPDKFLKMHKENGVIELLKMLEKYPKLKAVMNLSSFNAVKYARILLTFG